MIESGNDIIVLNALEKGDSNAFDQVYHLYFKPLCYFAEKLTGDNTIAQDLVTDSFVKLLRKRPHFETLANLRSFLYTTTRNGCFDHVRSEKRHRNSHSELMYLSADNENEIENAIVRAEVLNAIYTAIEKLPNKYKEVVKLALVEGKSNDEIVAETGMAYQTVRNHKSEGIKLLRIALFKNGNLSDIAIVYLLVYLSQHLKGF